MEVVVKTPDAGVSDACRILGLKKNEVYRLCDSGKLTHYQYGDNNARIRFCTEDLHKFLEASRKGSVQTA